MAQQVSVTLPASMLEEIEESAEEYGYTNRSEFIRDAARERLREGAL